MKLTRDDYAALEKSWINRKIADEAKLYRLPSLEARDLVGRRGGGNYAGVVFPYFQPGELHSVVARLRLDNPPVEAATGKPQHKYLSAPGARNRVYFPRCDPALLGDAALPVIITEGEKKCLSLWRAALESSNGTGKPAFLPVGLPGVWNWRGTVGVRMTPLGERVPQKGVTPDFDRIAWTGRKVTILFDVNVVTNESVRAARRELARELARRGAEVWLADLPPAGGVNGVDDFLHLFGVARLGEVLKQAVRYEWREELLRGKNGGALRLLANAITAFRSAPEWAGVLAYDEFSLAITTTRETPWGSIGRWSEQEDRLATNWLQRHGICVSIGDTAAAVETVARDRSYHPVRQYLNTLKWDQIPRLDDWLTLYLGVEPTNLTRALGAKFLVSAVARVRQPGCQADHCLILEGPQGQGKSSAVRALATPWSIDDLPELGSKDAALGILGAWLVELSELDAMSRAEVTRTKSFLSRPTDHFRPPYGRRVIDYPRQCVFVGTVNHSEYLRDETGGRRFWPVTCGRIDLNTLRRDRDQLWAEASARYKAGERWWLEGDELNTAAKQVQEDRYQRDPWEQLTADWIEGRTGVTTAEVLRQALFKESGIWTRADETRVGAILRRLGWEPVGCARPRIYRQPTQPQP
jgi:predicted P-loop ATPase